MQDLYNTIVCKIQQIQKFKQDMNHSEFTQDYHKRSNFSQKIKLEYKDFNKYKIIETILIQLRLWCFLVLPLSGYVLGQLLKFLLGIKEPSEFSALIVHIITTVSIFIIYSDLFSSQHELKNRSDKILFISVTYPFVLGINLGLIKGII